MKRIAIGGYALWLSLGFYRGMETYKGDFEESLKKHSKDLEKASKVLVPLEDQIRVYYQTNPPDSSMSIEERIEDLKKGIENLPEKKELERGIRTRLESTLSFEEKYGALKITKPVFFYTSMLSQGLGTGLFYGVLPLSVYSAPSFEFMRLEMLLRDLKKEDLPNPSKYYFRL